MRVTRHSASPSTPDALLGTNAQGWAGTLAETSGSGVEGGAYGTSNIRKQTQGKAHETVKYSQKIEVWITDTLAGYILTVEEKTNWRSEPRKVEILEEVFMPPSRPFVEVLEEARLLAEEFGARTFLFRKTH